MHTSSTDKSTYFVQRRRDVGDILEVYESLTTVLEISYIDITNLATTTENHKKRFNLQYIFSKPKIKIYFTYDVKIMYIVNTR